jgi:hypothetical protein
MIPEITDGQLHAHPLKVDALPGIANQSPNGVSIRGETLTQMASGKTCGASDEYTT